MWDQFKNPEDRFSHNEALYCIVLLLEESDIGSILFALVFLYENMSMQYTFKIKKIDIFFIFAQNIDSGTS